jgi:hypothetical protein
MVDVATMLAGGDRRSIGQANTVLALLHRDAARFDEVFTCLTHPDRLVRMRAADALEKFSRDNAALFGPHKRALLAQTLEDGTAEMRWHLIAIAARLTLDETDVPELCSYLERCVRHDPSRIVKVMALQAASDLAGRYKVADRCFFDMITYARASPWPSLRARAANLCLDKRMSGRGARQFIG